jgi:hypothetical protein
MEAGLAPKMLFETASVEAARSLVALRAAMVTACDAMYRPRSLEGGRIEVRDLADRCNTTDLGVARRNGTDLPAAVRCFLKVCDNVAAGLCRNKPGRIEDRMTIRSVRSTAGTGRQRKWCRELRAYIFFREFANMAAPNFYVASFQWRQAKHITPPAGRPAS